MTAKQNLSIGIFVIIAMISAGILVMVFGSSDALVSTWELKARMADLGGPVNRGAPVRLMGIPVGKLVDVELSTGPDPHVQLTMKIHEGITVLDDSVLVVESDGFVGDRILTILPGASGSPLQDGSSIRGMQPVSLRETLDKARGTVTKLESAVDELTSGLRNVNNLIGTEEFVDDVHGSAREFHETTRKAREVLETYAAMAQSLRVKLDDLADASLRAVNNFDSQITSVSESSSQVIEDIHEGWGDVTVFLKGLEESRQKLDRLLVKIDKGEGSLGRLVSDDEFIEELQDTIVSVQRFINGVRDDPSQLVWGPEKPKARRMTLMDVEALVDAGVHPRTIALQIEATRQKFTLEARTLVALKNKGWDDRILEALVASGR